MPCLCFSRDDRDGVDNSKVHDSPSQPKWTSSNASGDRHQSSSLSAPVPANIGKIPELRDPSGPVPTPRPNFPIKKEGLSLLQSPVLDDESGKAYDFDVIAIHGLNGHPCNTWTSDGADGQVFWLRDFLPKALPGARIFTYGYDSKLFWSSSTGDIDTYAKGLLDRLDLERQQTPAQSSRPIIFICHSLGGLVCKKSLIIANENKGRYQSILDSTRAIFFFGTPHQGSDFADTAGYFSRLLDSGAVELIGGRGKPVRSELIKELSPKSKTLEQLCAAFVHRADAVRCIISFFELNKLRGNVIVSKRSATIGVAHESVEGVEGDHRRICRIKDETEYAFRRIVHECRKLSSGIPEKHRPLNHEEQQCLNSLALSSFTKLPDTEITPAKGTCEWILSVEQFKTWRNGLHPVLWISGERGCGKTTLMSFIRYHMPKTGAIIENAGNSTECESTFCGFFCDDRNKDLTSATVLLQGLIWDIFLQRHDLIHHALDYYLKYYQSSCAWSYIHLWQIFQAILDDPHTRGVCVVIDALDECNRKDRVRLLRDLDKYLERRPRRPSCPIIFVLSSRPATIVNLPGLQVNPCLRLDEDPVLRRFMAADIRRFVLDDLLIDDQFSYRNDPDRSVKIKALADIIATKSDGSVLWASLVLQEMRAKTFVNTREVEEFISICPVDLYSIYYESLAKVRDRREIIVKSLHIILAARRPLTVAEFKFALAIESGHHTLGALQRDTIERLDNITLLIGGILGSLIRISDTTITLRHQSVKDFLLNGLAGPQDSPQQKPLKHSSELSDTFRISMSEAEKTLAGCCISFLNLKDFAKRSFRDKERDLWEDSGLGAICVSDDTRPESPNSIPCWFDREYQKPETPFFDYAASNWGFHFAASESVGEDLTNAALKLSTATNTLINWSRQFRKSHRGSDKLPESLDALVVAAYFGQTTIIKKLAFNNLLNSSWPVGLTWASRMGHSGVVKILIEFGTPCAGAMLDGRSAFSWATAGGFFEVVDTLLSHDRGLINARDHRGFCPLSWAVDNYDIGMVEKILGSDNVDVNLRSKEGTAPIHIAISRHGHSTDELEILRKLLCDLRVDITVRDKRGRTFLSYAAEFGSTESIQELLDCSERQEDVDKLLDDGGDERGLSPLSYAAWRGHSDTVHLLCRTRKIGSQLRSVDKLDGGNVFYNAAKGDKAEVIRILGKYFPDGVDSCDLTGHTPLSIAMGGSFPDVVHALLDLGADVNLACDDGRTPLSHGVDKIELVKILAGRGADINLPDKAGHTPLWWAHASPNAQLLQTQLVELGARL